MRLTTLFDGPVPQPPRLYVVGVDRARESDRPAIVRLTEYSNSLVWLCSIPGTPFTGRFWFRPE